MTLRSARVRDFQSNADTAVEFGGFTVLVGPSNSGKSGFLRAIRACLRNTAVPANVRQGTSKAVIDVAFEDVTVGIERGKSLSTYRLRDEHDDEHVQTFTKSGRTVPDEVAAAIRLPLIGGVDATFAFQFDRPFLLAEPGSTIAQVIGSLTNVSLLHAAVRETNRRRQEASGLLRVRKDDVLRLHTQVRDFTDLKRRKATLEQAETLLADVRGTEQRLARLSDLVVKARTAQTHLDRLHAEQPPDAEQPLARAEGTVRSLRNVRRSFRESQRLTDLIRFNIAQARQYRDQADQAEADYQAHLAGMGTCPTCGQEVDKKQHQPHA